MTYEERERGPSQSKEEPRGRRVFLACHNTLQKQEPMAAILDFLQREGCIITSMDDFEGADYEAMYAAIEQSDVFISVLDELIYSTQALLLLIHACSSGWLRQMA